MIFLPPAECTCGHTALVHIGRCCAPNCFCQSFRDAATATADELAAAADAIPQSICDQIDSAAGRKEPNK